MVKGNMLAQIIEPKSVTKYRIDCEKLDRSSFCSVKKSCDEHGKITKKRPSGKFFAEIEIGTHSVTGKDIVFGYVLRGY